MSTIVNCVVSLALSLTATSIQAGFYTGNDMIEFCGTSESERAHYSRNAQCIGHIVGVAAYDDALSLPNGVAIGQLTNVVEKFMADNSAEMHRPGPQVVAFAVFDAFPCE